METIYYSRIDVDGYSRPTPGGIRAVLERARVCGYRLIKFGGWGHADLRLRREDVEANERRVREFEALWPEEARPRIVTVDMALAEREPQAMSDEEATSIARASLSDIRGDHD